MTSPILNTESIYYKGYDVLKFLLAILIVAAHTQLFIEFPSFHYYFSILCSCAIPTFFAVSSFLFIKKIDCAKNKSEERNIFYKTIKRQFCIFGIWYIIMFPMAYFRFWDVATIKESIYAILFSCSLNGYWFFKALIINTAILYFFRRNKSLCILSILAVIIYLFWAYNYKLHFIRWSISPYYSFYYHIFPFCIGALYARKDWMKKQSVSVLVILFLACYLIATFNYLNPVGRALFPCVLLPLFNKLQFTSISPQRCLKYRQTSILFYVMQFVLIWIYDMAYTNYLAEDSVIYQILDSSAVRFIFILILLYVISTAFLYVENTEKGARLKYMH